VLHAERSSFNSVRTVAIFASKTCEDFDPPGLNGQTVVLARFKHSVEVTTRRTPGPSRNPCLRSPSCAINTARK